jgi:hypothetical protein
MSKQKKKRNKVYSGADASVSRPIITRLEAADRNKLSQWWFDRKRTLKPILITSGVVILVVWFIFEMIRVFSGS